MKEDPIERRSEHRRIINRYYTVEFLINNLQFAYQFKIWDISSKGISLLVNEESDLLHYLKVGDTLYLKYHAAGSSKSTQYLKTSIHHISKDDREEFKGYYVFGLSILDDQVSGKEETVKIVCPSCYAMYRIRGTKMPKTRTVVRCRKCGGKIDIEP